MSEEKVKGYIAIGLDYELEVTKEGKVLSKCSKKDGLDPFVTNAIRMLKCIFASTEAEGDSIALTDVIGESTNFWGSGFPVMGALGEAGNTLMGPVVGISDLSFVRTQFRLDSKVVHGSGGGQLLYSETTVDAATEENNTGRFRIIRAFTNSSGSSITVKEIAIYVYNNEDLGSFMLCRDVLASPQTIPDGATLTLRFRMFLSYA